MTFVTHPEHIRRILRGIGWPTIIPEFDPPHELATGSICQLFLDTHDGFPEPADQAYHDTGPDPPHCDDIRDPPHWED